MATLTPILDKELVKLRRRLGDIYDSSGTLIQFDTNPVPSGIWVGDAALMSTWTAAELLDCYNDAIRIFVDYCLKFLSIKSVGEFIPGYLVFSPNVQATKVTINTVDYWYVDIDNLTPKMYRIISAKDANDTRETSLGAYIPPEEFFASRIYRSRDNQLLYTHGFIGSTVNKNCVIMLNLDSGEDVDLYYVKQHTDYVENNASPGDVSGITTAALRRIILIAEVIAQRYRSMETRDIADSELNIIMQSDASLLGRK